MKCEYCGEREAEVRLIDVTNTQSSERRPCAICVNGKLRRDEDEMAHGESGR